MTRQMDRVFCSVGVEGLRQYHSSCGDHLVHSSEHTLRLGWASQQTEVVPEQDCGVERLARESEVLHRPQLHLLETSSPADLQRQSRDIQPYHIEPFPLKVDCDPSCAAAQVDDATLDESHGFPFNLRPFIKPGKIARAIKGINETVVSLDDVERAAALPGVPHCVTVHVPGDLQGRPCFPSGRLMSIVSSCLGSLTLLGYHPASWRWGIDGLNWLQADLEKRHYFRNRRAHLMEVRPASNPYGPTGQIQVVIEIASLKGQQTVG